jgi:hypothetical protein
MFESARSKRLNASPIACIRTPKLDEPSRALAQLVGVSPTSLSRLGRSRLIHPEGKGGALAILFVRPYRGLDSLLGGDDSKPRAWLSAENAYVGGVPRELIRSAEGLVCTIEHVDAMRGKSYRARPCIDRGLRNGSRA